MRIDEPYHEGERAVQERAGERIIADSNGRVIDTAIPKPALGFIRQQGMAVLSSVDGERRPWASILFGSPGFVNAETPERITVDRTNAWVHFDDPFWGNIESDARCGMLLLELATRRRLRVNGSITLDGELLTMSVESAYPNCPKYIQRRHLSKRPTEGGSLGAAPIRGTRLTTEQGAMIEQADTLFVASLHPDRGADASHRGGQPGFARVLDESTIRIPDYPGNSMFNTLGNFSVHPTGGIVIPDFSGKRTLQLVGDVKVQWDLDDPAGVTGGTGRFWDFSISETLELPMPMEATWEFLDASPFNP
jgi:predicted pyridoxine 5'-phosphate oxidase superfamily flavin-nucleotide-binding protein